MNITIQSGQRSMVLGDICEDEPNKLMNLIHTGFRCLEAVGSKDTEAMAKRFRDNIGAIKEASFDFDK